MSIRRVPVLVCDGCGTVIENRFYLTARPTGQKIVQHDPCLTPERNFCCEACQAWWNAQFPADGPWGPAWDERDWWCEHVGPCAERSRVRTVYEEAPLVDNKVHFEDPEPLVHS